MPTSSPRLVDDSIACRLVLQTKPARAPDSAMTGLTHCRSSELPSLHLILDVTSADCQSAHAMQRHPRQLVLAYGRQEAGQGFRIRSALPSGRLLETGLVE